MSLTLSGVSAHYPGAEAQPSLRQIDLKIGGRGCLAVVGPSGSGKSTLGRVLNGLLRASTGTVALDGQDMAKLESLAIARRRVGLLMQQPDNQLFGVTVGQDIRFGPMQAGLDEAICQDRMEEALRRVGLDQKTFVSRSPFSLSGGERRRVALAGLLAMKPGHLVLDEPIAGLDPAGRDSIESVIAQTAEEISVVLLTADLPLALRLADRVLLLEEGRVVFDGTPAASVADQGLITRLRLMVPVQVELLAGLAARGVVLPATGDLRPRTVVRTIVDAMAYRGERSAC